MTVLSLLSLSSIILLLQISMNNAQKEYTVNNKYRIEFEESTLSQFNGEYEYVDEPYIGYPIHPRPFWQQEGHWKLTTNADIILYKRKNGLWYEPENNYYYFQLRHLNAPVSPDDDEINWLICNQQKSLSVSAKPDDCNAYGTVVPGGDKNLSPKITPIGAEISIKIPTLNDKYRIAFEDEPGCVDGDCASTWSMNGDYKYVPKQYDPADTVSWEHDMEQHGYWQQISGDIKYEGYVLWAKPLPRMDYAFLLDNEELGGRFVCGNYDTSPLARPEDCAFWDRGNNDNKDDLNVKITPIGNEFILD